MEPQLKAQSIDTAHDENYRKKMKELLKMIGSKGMYKDIGTGASVAKDIKVYLEINCEKVTCDQINTHKEVIPFANGCVYHVS